MKPSQRATRILIVDDEEKIREIVAAILASEGYVVETARDGIEALAKDLEFRPDILVVDLQMARMDGIETIVRVKERSPDALAIVLTAHGSIESAVQAMKRGAYDYLTKPFDNDQLLMVVRRAHELVRISRELEDLREKLGQKNVAGSILGESAAMRDLRDQVQRIAGTDATVLVEGESGTGKELAARAIHFESRRRNKPLMTVDCTALPASLVESSFFGYEKGAFTDAHNQKAGAFEEADGGTLFLDEISELPPEAQAKLLRVLQEKEFTRVGGTVPVKVDVRVIAATNRPLEALTKAGVFREDLFYRLNVLRLRIPALREHAADIPLYARAFVAKHRGTLASKVTDLSEEALDSLKAKEWRGNIRELENAVQRAMLGARGAVLQREDFVFPGTGDRPILSSLEESGGLEAYVRSRTEEVERRIILETLEETRWNRTEAAKKLAISRKTLFNKMQQYGIEHE